MWLERMGDIGRTFAEIEKTVADEVQTSASSIRRPP